MGQRGNERRAKLGYFLLLVRRDAKLTPEADNEDFRILKGPFQRSDAFEELRLAQEEFDKTATEEVKASHYLVIGKDRGNGEIRVVQKII